MQRRDVLRGAAGLAAGAGLSLASASGESDEKTALDVDPNKAAVLPPGIEPAQEKRKGDVLYRKLGKTDEWVSAMGVGGYHIGMCKEQDESTRIVRTAIDHGLTFMDNCWDYHEGKSEEWMGAALQDGYRDKVFLMTKLDGRTKESAAHQIDDSLKRLRTDHIDLMQIHENIRMEDADRCFAPGGTIEAMEEAKKAGKIRYFGFTGHKDPLVHHRMLDVAARHKFHFDTAQMPINPLDASFRSFTRDFVPRLIKEGLGLLGMKPMGSGAIVQNKIATPQECLTFALTMPTSVVITGMESMDVLEQNLKILKEFKPMEKGEMEALITRTRKAAESGDFEKFKTTNAFDGTANNPKWLG